MSISGDLWYVKLSDGDVHRVTLDQLDEAFQAGHIDAQTMVLAAGETQWSKLGDLAGMDDAEALAADVESVDHTWSEEEEAPPVRSAPASTFAAPTAVAPSQHVSRPHPATGSPSAYVPQAQVVRAGPAPQAFDVPASPFASAASAFGAPGSNLGVAASAYGAAFSSNRPQATVGQPFGAPVPAPGPSVIPMMARGTPMPSSLRPLSVDFGELDVDARKLRGGAGKRWFGVLVGLAVVGGVAAVAVQRPSWAQPLLGRIGVHSATAAAAPAPPPPTPLAPEPAPPPPAAEPSPVAPAIATPAGESPMNPHFTNQTNEGDVKAHPTPEPKPGHGHKGHGGAPGGAGHASPPKGKSTVFTTGGNKYDPLNSSI